MSQEWRTRLVSRGTKVVLLKRVLSEFSLFQRSAKVSNREEPIRTGFVENARSVPRSHPSDGSSSRSAGFGV